MCFEGEVRVDGIYKGRESKLGEVGHDKTSESLKHSEEGSEAEVCFRGCAGHSLRQPHDPHLGGHASV